jgi:ribosomal protein S2
LSGLAGFDHYRRSSGGVDMAIPLNEIALASIAIIAVGCWLLAEFIELFEDQKRMRQRYARPLV